MKKEDIEKAAKNYSASLNFEDYGNISTIRMAFEEGAEWRINSVWHDVSEQPHRNTWYIVQIGDNEFDIFADSDNWEDFSRFINATRWAYVSDLLPERKEVGHEDPVH